MGDGSSEALEPLKDTTEGVVLPLYQYLWSKNKQGEACGVCIPHTVIYRNAAPVSWFFTSMKEGKLMRKKRSNMQAPAMAETFLSGKPEVCAWFSGSMLQVADATARTAAGAAGRPRAPGATARLNPDNSDDDEDAPKTRPCSWEHMSYERAQPILDPGPYRLMSEQPFEGMLQRFVEPREACDSMFRAIWTPSAAVFEKRINRHQLAEPEVTPPPSAKVPRPPLHELVASFAPGTPAWLHDHSQVTCGAIKSRLQAQCDAVASHIADVSSGKALVCRMDLFFKVDVQNRLWLLYCGALQLDKAAAQKPRLPHPALSNGSHGHGHTSFVLKDPTKPEQELEEPEEKGSFVCALTGRVRPRRERIQVTYKQLLQAWFKKCEELVLESDRRVALDEVPPAIRRANPNLSREFYLRSRSQPFFLLNLADVCPEAEEELSRSLGTHSPTRIPTAADGTPLRSKRASYGSPSGGSKPGTPQGQEAGRPLPTALMPRTATSMEPAAAADGRPASSASARTPPRPLTHSHTYSHSQRPPTHTYTPLSFQRGPSPSPSCRPSTARPSQGPSSPVAATTTLARQHSLPQMLRASPNQSAPATPLAMPPPTPQMPGAALGGWVGVSGRAGDGGGQTAVQRRHTASPGRGRPGSTGRKGVGQLLEMPTRPGSTGSAGLGQLLDTPTRSYSRPRAATARAAVGRPRGSPHAAMSGVQGGSLRGTPAAGTDVRADVRLGTGAWGREDTSPRYPGSGLFGPPGVGSGRLASDTGDSTASRWGGSERLDTSGSQVWDSVDRSVGGTDASPGRGGGGGTGRPVAGGAGPGYLRQGEWQTLKQLSVIYAEAEQQTQALLSQAYELLNNSAKSSARNYASPGTAAPGQAQSGADALGQERSGRSLTGAARGVAQQPQPSALTSASRGAASFSTPVAALSRGLDPGARLSLTDEEQALLSEAILA